MEATLREILSRLDVLDNKMKGLGAVPNNIQASANKSTNNHNNDKRTNNKKHQQRDNSTTATYKKSRKQGKNSHNIKNKKNPPRNETTEPAFEQYKSDNPNFANAVKAIYRSVQLNIHRHNWMPIDSVRGPIPEAIESRIDSLFKFISPPLKDDKLVGKLTELQEHIKTTLEDIMVEHLYEKYFEQGELYESLILNIQDARAARECAARVVRRRYGHKVSSTHLEEWLDDVAYPYGSDLFINSRKPQSDSDKADKINPERPLASPTPDCSSLMDTHTVGDENTAALDEFDVEHIPKTPAPETPQMGPPLLIPRAPTPRKSDASTTRTRSNSDNAGKNDTPIYKAWMNAKNTVNPEFKKYLNEVQTNTTKSKNIETNDKTNSNKISSFTSYKNWQK